MSRRVFWVPKEARWDYIQDRAKQPEIGKIIDDAMDSIEKDNREQFAADFKNLD